MEFWTWVQPSGVSGIFEVKLQRVSVITTCILRISTYRVVSCLQLEQEIRQHTLL